jgi:hypothetical protein
VVVVAVRWYQNIGAEFTIRSIHPVIVSL